MDSLCPLPEANFGPPRNISRPSPEISTDQIINKHRSDPVNISDSKMFRKEFCHPSEEHWKVRYKFMIALPYSFLAFL